MSKLLAFAFILILILGTSIYKFPPLPPVSELYILRELVCFYYIPMPFVPYFCPNLFTGQPTTPPATKDCIFCKFATNSTQEGESRLVFSDANFVAFKDINPSASIHLLIIPRQHIGTIRDLNSEHMAMIQKMKDIGHFLLNNQSIPISRHVLGFHIPPFTVLF
jgi:hypothetical protein